MILQTNVGTYTQECRALNDFMKKNSGYVDIDKYIISEIIVNKEVNFAPLNSKFGFFSRFFGFKKTNAPFYQMIGPLRDTIIQVLSMEIFSKLKFFVMFDDLDVKYKLTRENDRKMLMDLIRIAKRYNTEYLHNSNARILLFVRDDVIDGLEGIEGGDVAKIFSSYEYRINWYVHDLACTDERNILLRKFINKETDGKEYYLGCKQTEKTRSFNKEQVPFISPASECAIYGKDDLSNADILPLMKFKVSDGVFSVDKDYIPPFLTLDLDTRYQQYINKFYEKVSVLATHHNLESGEAKRSFVRYANVLKNYSTRNRVQHFVELLQEIAGAVEFYITQVYTETPIEKEEYSPFDIVKYFSWLENYLHGAATILDGVVLENLTTFLQ